MQQQREQRRPRRRSRLYAAALLATAVVVTGCASPTAEPAAESPGPSAQPTPTATPVPASVSVSATATVPPPSQASTPPPPAETTVTSPGRQPPLPNPNDVDVSVALDTIAYLAGDPGADAATERVEAQLTAYGFDVDRAEDYLVASRGPIPPGRPWHLLSATFDEPASVGTLLTVAAAFTSRSTYAPLALVVAGPGVAGATYSRTLAEDRRTDLELSVDLAGTGDSADAIRPVVRSLVGRL